MNKATMRFNRAWADREPHEKLSGLVAATSQDLEMDFYQWIMFCVQVLIFAGAELHGKEKKEFRLRVEKFINSLNPNSSELGKDKD